MNQVRAILAAALFTLLVTALNANIVASTAADGTVVAEGTAVELGPLQQAAGCCWIMIVASWYCVPCS
jgi:hypothetical protein